MKTAGEGTELAHLFRHESGRLLAALVRLFGTHNLALAEDVLSDALCRAVEVWKFSGVPDDPRAWLLTAARNRAIDVLRREKTARDFSPDLTHLVSTEWSLVGTVSAVLSGELADEQLSMMFACCHRTIPEPTQVALMLHVLSGFSAAEVARAFLVPEAAMLKRLQRGKASLAELRDVFHEESSPLGGDGARARTSAVLGALYLLFNEGYHGSSPDDPIRAELCLEAIRLVELLTRHPTADSPETRALAALMCLHASRLPARTSPEGELLTLSAQDRSLWDRSLIARGLDWLESAAEGDELSAFHVEAAIAAEHAFAASHEATQWGRIRELYELLYRIRPTPVVALGRAIAHAEAHGPAAGLAELDAIADRERLANYPFLEAAHGELHLRLGHAREAASHFERALALARSDSERRFLERRLALSRDV
ncbi:MAG: DUF6596 domain-containing protein [Polyangiaceae bacterium]